MRHGQGGAIEWWWRPAGGSGACGKLCPVVRIRRQLAVAALDPDHGDRTGGVPMVKRGGRSCLARQDYVHFAWHAYK